MNRLCVAICTYNRQEFLENCMARIIPQIAEQQGVTLLIVDNNSSDDTSAIVSRLSAEYDFISYVFCAEQGLSFARNMALNECNAQWLSFLDDDGYPCENWLEENLRIIASGDFEAFGGDILPWYRDGKKGWFKDVYEKSDKFRPTEDTVRLKVTDPYFSGGNCTYSVEPLKAIGGFNVSFGMNGQAMGYGEETNAQRQMAIKGARLGYSKKMVLHHYIGLNKQSARWRLKRNYINGRDFWIIWEKSPNSQNLKRYFVNSLKKSFFVTFVAIKAVFSGKDGYNMHNLLYEISYWANPVGLLVGLLSGRYPRNN